MGDWNITINGTGQHHNQGDEKDADVIAKELVEKLIEADHKVRFAEFTSGSALRYPDNKPSLG